MTRINHLTIGLAVLLMIIQTTYASFGLCVMENWFPSDSKTVVGFQIFNDQDDNGAQYRSLYGPNKSDFQNNGWKVHMTFDQRIFFKSAYVSHSVYGDIGYVGTSLWCEAGRYKVHYGCYDNTGGSYCSWERQIQQSNWCRENYRMGTDSGTC
ncbi:hypothetical protein BGZ76_000985 [Entomortierella beljakovae]|nr:hypothetical protein BGZ76_000985 [Entomortierella beljakovae]